ncbi:MULTISPECIES: DUF4179 domain-containing protein [Paenibacillus]|uniref:DUF4179 domain-containing protein n=1 Tax=Paenibacillus TaxID=44249 RepID=UPI0003FC2555|nr:MULTISPECIES: DUF4179 domain-containing protein [Paenibacillus]KGP80624.1 hypothetical protein P364_0118500 [Paenibacillus sp. MAEPY2]KGP86087.1 hypothetical protein P363_0119200 [Paenibacillus sp. MAEPY1]OZQ73402.1 hypothetical protein CA599_03885 [Paenibacillus taichungensis]HBU82220.1 DUF4179 domain-containing protein [Paenibacillus sp.]
MNFHDPVDREIKQLFNAKRKDLIIPDTVQLAMENALSSLSEQNTKKRYPHKRWRWVAAVIALFFILGTVSVYSVPTFGEMIRSLFAKDNPDIGLMRAQELGLVHNPHIKVRDKGYTLVIDEAVADPTRVTLALQLFDKKGKHNRDKLLLGDLNNITIKDDKGNELDTMYDMGYTNDFYYMVAFFNEPLQTDKITIEGNIGTLGNRNEPFIEGDWDFSFDIDMREANQQTKIEELSGSYSTPHGMTVTLKRLTRMVQGVRFELETELDAAAMARSPGDLWKKQMLSFHFETIENEEIHSVNPRKMGYMDSLMSTDHAVIEEGKIRWSYIFKYLPEHEPYRFILDGYSIAETDGSRISFKPSELIEPKSFQILTDRIEVVGTTLKDSQNRDGTYETAVSFYGEMDNEIRNEEWKAYDSEGKQYEVSKRGASSLEGALADNWREGVISMGDRSMRQPYEYRITGLDYIPDELILIRQVVDKWYKDPDWSVLLK